MEFKKSPLELKLEEEGWVFLTNLSHDELETHYAQDNFKEEVMKGKIIITNAFDIYGNPIEEMKAMYLKRKID